MKRRPPLDSRWRSVLVALLSFAAVAGAVVYLALPKLGTCDGCASDPITQTAYDVFSIATLVIAAYFLALYVIGLRNARGPALRATKREPFFVILTPAHDEELVIEATVRRLRSLDVAPDRFLALIVNDGSNDRTSEVALAAAEDDDRILVLDRVKAIAGQGKGAVLNHGFQIISQLADWGDSRLHGATGDEIVVCVVDADGWLRGDALLRFVAAVDTGRSCTATRESSSSGSGKSSKWLSSGMVPGGGGIGDVAALAAPGESSRA